MTQGEVLEVFRQALYIAIGMSGPMLLVSIIIGLIIAIFQAATQIHEQTLTFVPKVLCIALLLLVNGSWMMTLMDEFFHYLFEVVVRL